MPNATVQLQDDLANLQVIARRVDAVGDEVAIVTPRADRATGVPIRVVRLLR